MTHRYPYFKSASCFAALVAVALPLSSPGQGVSNVMTVSPAMPTTATPIQISVPINVCSPPGPTDPLQRVKSWSSNVIGQVVSIAVELDGTGCFDGGGTVPLTFALQRLLAGAYSFTYTLSSGGIALHEESQPVSVTGVPTSIMPTNGMWWDPQQSGTGYSIDIRHGELLMTVFSYTVSGLPQWYLMSGQLTNNSTTGTLLKLAGGQCISCSYNPPSVIGDDGVATVIFTSSTTATILLPGGRITHIVPQVF